MPSPIAKVSDVVKVMEQWAPAYVAESWDRVGLQVGDPGAQAARIWTALELDDALLAQALEAGVTMLLVHHPPLFKPLSALRADHPNTARLLKAASAGMAIFAAHTNLDSAPGGVNDVLGRRLGLTGLAPVAPAQGGLVKLVVFTPPEAMEKISAALFTLGAGRVGDYRDCSFAAVGVGSYLAPPDGNPYLGNPGEKEMVEELRLEVVVPAGLAAKALAAAGQAHPYEQPAMDLYPLANGPAGFGLGRVGDLPAEVDSKAFARRAAANLGAAWAHLAGAPPARLSRVAVVGGSGGDMLAQAAAAGAQLLITGEASHHAAQEAADLGLGLLCLGHYATEVVVVEPWAERVARELAAQGLSSIVEPYTGGENPWHPVCHKEE